MAAKKRLPKQAGRDPDDAPALSQSWFDEADVAVGRKVVRRGRRPVAAKQQVVRLGRRSVPGSKR
jgi:hypothetical protein